MKFEPEKFFIGLMDFFSILLPGALLTCLLMDDVGPVVLGQRYRTLEGAAAWAAFLFASYLLGHLVFLIGSWLDEIYDCARAYTLNRQVLMLAHCDRLLSWPMRAVVWLVFKRERNLAVGRAGKLKEKALDPLQAKNAINTFQWSKALLNSKSPTSLAVVQRFEADSKFFRCFTVVLLLAAWPVQHRWSASAIPGSAWAIPVMTVLFLLALWRYMEQRYKSTNQAYWSVITLLAEDPKFAFSKPAVLAFAKPAASPATPTHAGGVVFRRRGKRVEYLLVEAKKKPNEWVLPKGHIEDDENDRETAVREVYEESGVWARIVYDLKNMQYPAKEDTAKEDTAKEDTAKEDTAKEDTIPVKDDTLPVKENMVSVKEDCVTVHLFLMQAVGRGLRSERERGVVWLPYEKALQAAKKQTQEKLERAKEWLSTGSR